MESSARRCAVTGANGYVGSRISRYFASRGWTVFEFTRRAGAQPGCVHVPFHLDSSIDPAVFCENEIRVLIHCAYDFRPVSWDEIHKVNVAGSTALLQAAHKAGVDKIILLSSISAFDGCSSLYGRAKLAIEKIATDIGAYVIRSGLVYGSQPSGGMFGSLQKIASKFPVIPLIGRGKYMQYLIHEEDLCELIFRISQQQINFPRVPAVAASPHGWQLQEILELLAATQHRRFKFVPLPWRVIWLGLKLSELCRITVPLRSDSVISLVRQDPSPDFSPAMQAGFRFRDFGTNSAASRAMTAGRENQAVEKPNSVRPAQQQKSDPPQVLHGTHEGDEI